ncbi:uracil-DNA glycosylase family protein [Thalassotalea profundi]|uniref:IclR family transcriptional regulator n=1 Tax=Thalassotalea profundi TaxID=2036687 RepID=A0ABQ3ICC2_9GAMM|nr:uracil-DNA glycosylase family protein [Thalassotalea profundi]GHE79012.1 IclR family transcriptional regulator [Thalassotalea profundi]
MKDLLSNIRSCTLCQDILPLQAKPILQASKNCKILIVGQAPGILTHEKGVPFDDLSGDRLRDWLGVDKKQFYDTDLFSILPMSFCYPGKGKSGDKPPIPLCAQVWRKQLLAQLTNVEFTIILGKYAVNWHLHQKASITELASQWKMFIEKKQIVLPHPSPRNNIWLKKNQWFDREVIPILQAKVHQILALT